MKPITLLLTLLLTACAGEAGDIGEEGITGPQGPQGPAGPQGLQGVQGELGPEGPAGPQGIAGDDGLDGVDGPQGPTGPTGSPGATGATGPAGDQGPIGPAIQIINGSGDPMGYPMMVDRGNDHDLAILCHMDFPPADFPEGWIVSHSPTTAVLFSGTGCTGTAYLRSTEISQTYKNVLYTVGPFGTELWDVTGTNGTRSPASADLGLGFGCQGFSGTINAAPAVKTTFTVDLDNPWTAVSY